MLVEDHITVSTEAFMVDDVLLADLSALPRLYSHIGRTQAAASNGKDEEHGSTMLSRYL